MNQSPWPVPDADTQEYWDAISERRFVIQQCRSCARFQYYPRSLCTACMSMDLEMVPSKGRGTIYSYTVSRRAAHPDMADRVPYVVGLIDLAEGPRMLANIVGSDPEDIAVGAAVEVTFLDVAEDVVLPAFQIVGPHDK